MNNSLIFVFGLIISLVSCGEPIESTNEPQKELPNILVVELEEANYLKEGSKVKNKGITIGEVIRLEGSCSGHRIYATIELKKNKHIPKNSEFVITSCDILGNKCIEIEYSNSNNYYEKGDTVLGTIRAFESDTTAMVNAMVHFLDSTLKLIEHLDQDSLKASVDSSLNELFQE